ncbi:unnamed protein product [Gongylonema pulchrum]|uniref:BHLH domain-containing protein n=1 Tax=Gongylonema pulchrum TaxID=637853 RepID=A0A183E189_9BILA|nr:unnamed protein product [Gongylonema pulchrum]
MHDLNDALDELRQCLPYSHRSGSRKMSKINTLLLASNWIKHLTNANSELRRQLDELRERVSDGAAPVPRGAMLSLFRIKHLTNANSELRRQLDELRERVSDGAAPVPRGAMVPVSQLRPPPPAPNALASLELLRPPVLPFKLVPETPKPLLRLSVPVPAAPTASVPVPVPAQACVKSINGFCFCVNCLIANTCLGSNK